MLRLCSIAVVWLTILNNSNKEQGKCGSAFKMQKDIGDYISPMSFFHRMKFVSMRSS